MRSGAIGQILAVNLLAGCGSTILPADHIRQLSNGGNAPPATFIGRQDLTENSIRVDVPANEWRMMRIDASEIHPDGVQTTLAVANFPNPGAQPWSGFAGQFFNIKNNQSEGPYSLSISGGRPDNPSASAVVTLAGYDPEVLRREIIVIFGSQNAPSTFYLGIVPEKNSGDTTGATTEPIMEVIFGEGETPSDLLATGSLLAEALAGRELLPTPNLESGFGGFGTTYFRTYASNGEKLEVRWGPLEFEEQFLLDGPEGTTVQRTQRIGIRQSMNEGGAFTYLVLSVRQAGLCEWSFTFEVPNFWRDKGSVHPCTSIIPSSTFIGTGADGEGVEFGAPVRLSASGPASPGSFSLEFSQVQTGRDGGDIMGELGPVSALATSATILYAGYLPADLTALYGWTPLHRESGI